MKELSSSGVPRNTEVMAGFRVMIVGVWLCGLGPGGGGSPEAGRETSGMWRRRADTHIFRLPGSWRAGTAEQGLRALSHLAGRKRKIQKRRLMKSK